MKNSTLWLSAQRIRAYNRAYRRGNRIWFELQVFGSTDSLGALQIDAGIRLSSNACEYKARQHGRSGTPPEVFFPVSDRW